MAGSHSAAASQQDQPRARIAAECQRRGLEAFVSGCVTLLTSDDQTEDLDVELIEVLGGEHADYVLSGREGSYWCRVWAARGLLWAWHDSATEAVIEALRDDSWRVREMAAKVIARHEVGAALEPLSQLAVDPVPRVRRAAERATSVLVEAGA